MDLISRQAAIEAVKTYWKKVVDDIPKGVGFEELTQLCSMALEHNANILKAIDQLPSAQPEKRTEERAETHACDLISRQALCEYALNQKDKCVTPNDIMRFPSAQPEEVTPHKNYKYLSDYWCECGWHLGKKGEVKYCSECGRKVNWDG